MISKIVEEMYLKNTAIKVLSYEDMQDLLMSFKKEPGVIDAESVEGDCIDILENAMSCMPAVMVESWADGEKAAVTAAEIAVNQVLDIISSCNHRYIIINYMTDEYISLDTFLEVESFIKEMMGNAYNNKNTLFMVTVKSNISSDFTSFNIVIYGISDN